MSVGVSSLISDAQRSDDALAQDEVVLESSSVSAAL
jgi:hypothetical protein